MSTTTESITTISCLREYDPLKRVILCPPKFMKIRDVINETQKHYIDENINTDKVITQHQHLVHTLQTHQIETILLPAEPQYPEQVFTRDIGFTLGTSLFIAQMKRSIRQGEEQILTQYLNQMKLPFIPFTQDHIEGGDVLIDHPNIWIGDSARTSSIAIDKLEAFLPQFTIHNVPFDADYLHLDCVFNVVSNSDALIFPPAFGTDQLKLIRKHYDCIEVPKDEQFTLGTNVLSIGQKRIISLPQNKHVNQILRSKGFEIIEVDISEIIKSGGSFRCITLPLLRSES